MSTVCAPLFSPKSQPPPDLAGIVVTPLNSQYTSAAQVLSVPNQAHYVPTPILYSTPQNQSIVDRNRYSATHQLESRLLNNFPDILPNIVNNLPTTSPNFAFNPNINLSGARQTDYSSYHSQQSPEIPKKSNKRDKPCPYNLRGRPFRRPSTSSDTFSTPPDRYSQPNRLKQVRVKSTSGSSTSSPTSPRSSWDPFTTPNRVEPNNYPDAPMVESVRKMRAAEASLRNIERSMVENMELLQLTTTPEPANTASSQGPTSIIADFVSRNRPIATVSNILNRPSPVCTNTTPH